jgi:hypothetical protein
LGTQEYSCPFRSVLAKTAKPLILTIFVARNTTIGSYF